MKGSRGKSESQKPGGGEVAIPVSDDGQLDSDGGVRVERRDPILWKKVWGLQICWIWVEEKKRSERL